MIKLLIADDERNILTLISHLFRELNYEVITAINGEEAVQKALSERPNLIITDIIMPATGTDGFSVCRQIRNEPAIRDTPIIILSAMDDEYNKLTGFNHGADDYVTKPFNTEELKARVKALLTRYAVNRPPENPSRQAISELPPPEEAVSIDRIPTGSLELDQMLYGGMPKGSNILVVGELGSGKSHFSRKFLCEGLLRGERALMVTLDDSPNQIRRMISMSLNREVREYEKLNLLRFVDAWSWSSYSIPDEEPFAVNGILELNQLSGVIADASMELGQSIQRKLGGRRVIDQISSLLINFELPSVQRFITQIARTGFAFGNVTTLFLLEAGTVPDQVLNNIKYLMDGVIELSRDHNQFSMHVQTMKWAAFSTEKNWFSNERKT